MLLFITGLLLLTIRCNATAQQPDILIYKGKKYSLYTNPLERYFKKYPDKRLQLYLLGIGVDMWQPLR
jgi:hypothetical protein